MVHVLDTNNKVEWKHRNLRDTLVLYICFYVHMKCPERAFIPQPLRLLNRVLRIQIDLVMSFRHFDPVEVYHLLLVDRIVKCLQLGSGVEGLWFGRPYMRYLGGLPASLSRRASSSIRVVSALACLALDSDS